MDTHVSFSIDLGPFFAMAPVIAALTVWAAQRRAARRTVDAPPTDAVVFTTPIDPSVLQLPSPEATTADAPVPVRYPAYAVPDEADRQV